MYFYLGTKRYSLPPEIEAEIVENVYPTCSYSRVRRELESGAEAISDSQDWFMDKQQALNDVKYYFHRVYLEVRRGQLIGTLPYAKSQLLEMFDAYGDYNMRNFKNACEYMLPDFPETNFSLNPNGPEFVHRRVLLKGRIDR